MKNQLQITNEITFNFIEKLAILFGRRIILNTFVTTDQPFERANVNSTILIKSKINNEEWKNKKDIVDEKL